MNENIEDEFEAQAEAQAEAHFEQAEKQLDVVCPLSNEPVEEFPEGYFFPGRPDANFPKTLCGRKMSAADYRRILESGNGGVEFKNFHSKSKNKDFTARLRFNPAREYNGEHSPGVELFFAQPTATTVKCFKSGEFVTVGERSYRFAGFPDYRAWKEICGRKMSAEDHVKILQADGDAVTFEGFRSKKSGAVFKASLQLTAKKGEIGGKPATWQEASFPPRP